MIDYLKRNKLKLISAALGIYWLIIFTATTLPGKDLPKTGVSDKVEHFAAYGILAILLTVTLIFQKKYLFLRKYFSLSALGLISVYAAFDELHQIFIPGRDCEILDWSADFLGASIAILIVSIFFKKYVLKPREN